MRDPFFITGLPRSRTAWLANLFTTDVSFCHHDLSGRIKSVSEFRSHLPAMNYGDSDSGLIFFYEDLRKMFPQARWLFVVRDPEHSWKATEAFAKRCHPKIKLDAETKRVLHARMTATERIAKTDNKARFIGFNELSNLDVLHKAWMHLTPWAKWMPQRVRMLQQLKIEPLPSPERFEVPPIMASQPL